MKRTAYKLLTNRPWLWRWYLLPRSRVATQSRRLRLKRPMTERSRRRKARHWQRAFGSLGAALLALLWA